MGTPRLMDFPHRCRRLLGGLCWAQAADLCSVSGHVLLGGRPGCRVAWVSVGHFLKNSFLRQKKMRRAEQFLILMGQARFGDGKPLCSQAPYFPVG